jgi:hypothetical protein
VPPTVPKGAQVFETGTQNRSEDVAGIPRGPGDIIHSEILSANRARPGRAENNRRD